MRTASSTRTHTRAATRGARSASGCCAAILVLLVAAAPTRAAQLTYFAAFACGTMIGMLAVSFSLAGLVRVASGQGAKWATALHLGSAVASVVVGVVLAGRVVGGLGLG